MFLKQYLQSKKGMSLIEVMVGIAILAIALIPIMNYFASSTKMIHETGLRTQAVNLAKAKMEELKAKSFGELRSLEGSVKTADYGDITDYTNFKRKVKVQNLDYDAGKETVTEKVKVTVYWDNDKRHVTLETIIMKAKK